MMTANIKPEESTKTPAPALVFEQPSATSSADKVEDFERRLEALEKQPISSSEKPAQEESVQPAAVIKGGKNALLARIMAAQELAKQAKAHQPPAATISDKDEELLINLDPPPPIEAVEQPPPPPFEASLLPPPVDNAPPPSFLAVEESLPQPGVAPSPQLLPSAPPLEHAPPPDILAPPAVEDQGLVDFDMDGVEMTPEEKRAMMEEQRKIMAQIQQEKTANDAAIAEARAEAFDLRSNTRVAAMLSAEDRPRAPAPTRAPAPKPSGASRKVKIGNGQEVSLHGQEQTREAIAQGTASLVQCLSCQQWMQVTQSATLMFCPVCQVVSPVVEASADNPPPVIAPTASVDSDTAAISAMIDKEEELQMEEDRKLAEQLQQEEYAERPGRTRGSRSRRAPPAVESADHRSVTNAPVSQGSWWDSVFGSWSSSAPPASSANNASSTAPRPPASASAGRSQTETIRFSSSTDEHNALLRSTGGARVAERQPLFQCVVDSVSSVTDALTAPPEVQGVDSSSLLVTNATRQKPNEQG